MFVCFLNELCLASFYGQPFLFYSLLPSIQKNSLSTFAPRVHMAVLHKKKNPDFLCTISKPVANSTTTSPCLVYFVLPALHASMRFLALCTVIVPRCLPTSLQRALKAFQLFYPERKFFSVCYHPAKNVTAKGESLLACF